MKSRKHNDGITHINNRLKPGTLPIQCLTTGAATLQSICNVFSQTWRNHYAYFLNYYAKNVTQSLRRHYSNIITQDKNFYAYITQKLRINFASITQIVYAKYADITQIRLRSNYAIISVLRKYVTQKLRRNCAKLITQSLRISRNHYANELRWYTQINYANHCSDDAIITQFNYTNTITQFLIKSLRRLCKYRF